MFEFSIINENVRSDYNVEVKGDDFGGFLIYVDKSLIKCDPVKLETAIIDLPDNLIEIYAKYVSTENNTYVYTATGYSLREIKLKVTGNCTTIKPNKTINITNGGLYSIINNSEYVIIQGPLVSCDEYLINKLSYKDILYDCKFYYRSSEYIVFDSPPGFPTPGGKEKFTITCS